MMTLNHIKITRLKEYLLFKSNIYVVGVLMAAVPLAGLANKAVVLNSRDASITLIDSSNDSINTITGVGKEPHHLYPSPDGTELWIANAQSDNLLKINPSNGAILQRVNGVSDPYQLGFTNDGKYFITIGLRLNRVDIYSHQPNINNQGDQFKLLKRIPTGSMPSHVAFSQDQQVAYVTLQGDNQLIAIDIATQTIIWKTPVGKAPAGLWVTPKGMILVGIMGENYVQVIDPNSRNTIKKIITGKGAHALRGRGDGKTVFVSNRDNSSISAIDMETLTKLYDIPTDSGPDCMDISADGKTLWVTNRWARKVSAIDIATTKTIKQYPVGSSPHGVYLLERALFK
jgi:YVTN family beta-propeller protein